MMENPSTWGDAENVIHNAMVKFHYAKRADGTGDSLPKEIADALRAAGLLKENITAGWDDGEGTSGHYAVHD